MSATPPQGRVSLQLVQPAQPSPKEAVLERVKRMPRPNGMLQCNRCGCRTAVTAINGVFVKNGRVQGGSVIDKLVCDECRKQGIIVPMLPELKRV